MRAKRAKAPLTPVGQAHKTVSLPPVLDLKAAAPLAEELLRIRGADVQVDGSAVQRVGAQCIQVLVAARRSWQSDRCRFEIIHASDAFNTSASLLDAAKILFEPVENRS